VSAYAKSAAQREAAEKARRAQAVRLLSPRARVRAGDKRGGRKNAMQARGRVCGCPLSGDSTAPECLSGARRPAPDCLLARAAFPGGFQGEWAWI
jgi:hypothetical protein